MSSCVLSLTGGKNSKVLAERQQLHISKHGDSEDFANREATHKEEWIRSLRCSCVHELCRNFPKKDYRRVLGLQFKSVSLPLEDDFFLYCYDLDTFIKSNELSLWLFSTQNTKEEDFWKVLRTFTASTNSVRRQWIEFVLGKCFYFSYSDKTLPWMKCSEVYWILHLSFFIFHFP